MSKAHLEKFIDSLASDPNALQEAAKGTADPGVFLRNVREYAKGKGYEFTEEEVRAWVADYSRQLAGGEMSEAQLEGVAGGAGGAQAILIGLLLPAVQKMGDGSVMPSPQGGIGAGYDLKGGTKLGAKF